MEIIKKKAIGFKKKIITNFNKINPALDFTLKLDYIADITI